MRLHSVQKILKKRKKNVVMKKKSEKSINKKAKNKKKYCEKKIKKKKLSQAQKMSQFCAQEKTFPTLLYVSLSSLSFLT